jgi:Ca2+-binding RTX toxin-like protein
MAKVWIGTNNSDTFSAPTNDHWFIYGEGGDDYLYGAGGNDYLDGGAGADHTLMAGGAWTRQITVTPWRVSGSTCRRPSDTDISAKRRATR